MKLKRDPTVCTKQPYDTREEARQAAAAIAKRSPKYSMHAYKCKIKGCSKFHVTSSKKK